MQRRPTSRSTQPSRRDAKRCHTTPVTPCTTCFSASSFNVLTGWDEVVAAYRRAIRQRPDDGPAHYYLGTILLCTGQTDGAIAEFREAIRLKPDFTEGYIKLGLVLSNLKHDHAGAEKTLRDLIRFRADDHLAHFNLGCVLRVDGRLDEAMSEYRAAIRLNPDFAEAFCNPGRFCLV